MKKLIFAGLLFCSAAFSFPASVSCRVSALGESAAVGTGASVQLIAEDQARKCLTVVNKGNQIIYITFEAGGGATEGIPLVAGQVLEFSIVPTNAIYARSSSGTQTVLAVQGK